MIRVAWAPRASRALFDVFDYIAADNPEAAMRVIGRIRDTVALLSNQPQLGRRSRLKNRRELIVDQYVITYRIHRDHVWISALEHGAKRR